MDKQRKRELIALCDTICSELGGFVFICKQSFISHSGTSSFLFSGLVIFHISNQIESLSKMQEGDGLFFPKEPYPSWQMSYFQISLRIGW